MEFKLYYILSLMAITSFLVTCLVLHVN